MKSGGQITLDGEGIEEGLGKLHQAVDIGKVGDQAERDAHRSTALHAQVGKKLVPRNALSFEDLWQDSLRFSPEDLVQGVFREVEGDSTGTRVTKAAGTQGEVRLAGALFNHPLINDRASRSKENERSLRLLSNTRYTLWLLTESV